MLSTFALIFALIENFMNKKEIKDFQKWQYQMKKFKKRNDEHNSKQEPKSTQAVNNSKVNEHSQYIIDGDIIY
jgi:hypothetical protein